MPPWLTPMFVAVLASLTATLVLVGAYAYVYAQQRERHVGLWTLAWAAALVRSGCEIAAMLAGRSPLLVLGTHLGPILSTLLLLWGTQAFRGRRLAPGWFVGAAASAAWAVVGPALGLHQFWVDLPVFGFLGLVMVWTGVQFLRAAALGGGEKYLAGVVLMLWGLHRADYPFLGPASPLFAGGPPAWVPTAGYFLSAGLQLVAAMAIGMVCYRRTRDDLVRSEDRFRAIAQATPVPVVITRQPGGVILFANTQLEVLLGLAPGGAVGRQAVDFVFDPAERDALVQRVMAAREVVQAEFRLQRPDGRPFWVAARCRPVTFDGQPAMLSAFYDLTERRQAEDALREAHEALAAVVQAAPVSIISMDTQSRVRSWNPAAERIFGWTAAEALGQPLPALSLDRRAEHLARRERILAGEVVQGLELRLQRRDGGPVDVSLAAAPLYDAQGQITGILAVCEDITARKGAERALEESRRALATLLSNLPGMAYRRANDAPWTMEFASEGCLTLTGYRSEDLAGNRRVAYGDLIHADDRQMVWDQVQAAVSARRPFEFTYRVRTAEGSEKWVWEQGRGVFTGEGALVALEGFIADITARKQAEESLHASQHFAERIVSTTPDLLYIYDLAERRNVYANREITRVLGYTDQEMQALGSALFARILHPEDLAAVAAHHGRLAAAPDGEVLRIEYRMKHADGRWRWLRSKDTVFARDPAGGVRQIIGTAVDVTERREAEAALEETNQMLHALIQASPVPIAAVDRENRVQAWNPAAERLFGWCLDEVRGQPLPTVPPEEQAIQEVRRAEVLAGKILSGIQVRRRRRDGALLDIELHVAPFHNQAGDILGFVGVMLDITERQRQEAALRQSERHYRQAAETNRMLLQEVNHRVRNNLASLLSLVALTRQRARDVAGCADALNTRILAMTQVHTLLADAGWSDLELGALVKHLLHSLRHLAPHDVPVTVEGPAVWLRPRQVLPLALSVVELFTNSCKHGAHRGPQGRLAVAWQLDGQSAASGRTVRLAWREAGGPPITAPPRASLGVELVEGFVRFELGGQCRLRFPAAGADHALEFAVDGAATDPS